MISREIISEINPLKLERRRRSLFKENTARLGFVSYVSQMRKMLDGCCTCLDIGCGALSPTSYLDFDYTVGVDGHEETISAAKQNSTHHDYILTTAQAIRDLFSPKQFDCCVALDLIEHLTKEEGYTLIRTMEQIASKKVLLFTPNGFLPQQSNEDLQEHLSGWETRELHTLGFTVVGMHGPKSLRGEKHQHLLRPKILGGIVSEFLHYTYTHSRPEKAAALLAVKTLGS